MNWTAKIATARQTGATDDQIKQSLLAFPDFDSTVKTKIQRSFQAGIALDSLASYFDANPDLFETTKPAVVDTPKPVLTLPGVSYPAETVKVAPGEAKEAAMAADQPRKAKYKAPAPQTLQVATDYDIGQIKKQITAAKDIIDPETGTIIQKGSGYLGDLKAGVKDVTLPARIALWAVIFDQPEIGAKYAGAYKDFSSLPRPEGADAVLHETVRMTPGLATGLIGTAGKLATVAGLPQAKAVGALAQMGAMAPWFLQGTGDIYQEMIDNGVSHETARTWAPVGGAMYAAIEGVQFGNIANLGRPIMKKVVKNAITRLVIEKGVDWAKEVGEEGLQQLTQDVFVDFGKELDGIEAAPEDKDKLLRNLKETLKGSAGPMGILSALGLGGGMAKHALTRGRKGAVAGEDTEEAKKPYTPPVLPITEASGAAPAPAPAMAGKQETPGAAITPAPTVPAQEQPLAPAQEQVVAAPDTKPAIPETKPVEIETKPAEKAETVETLPPVLSGQDVPEGTVPVGDDIHSRIISGIADELVGSGVDADAAEKQAEDEYKMLPDRIKRGMRSTIGRQMHAVEAAQKRAEYDSKLGILNTAGAERRGYATMVYKDTPKGKILDRIDWANKPSGMVDIDHFKKVNDDYGHATGDDVLVTLAQLLSKRLEGQADVIRFGGEEFAIKPLTGSNILDIIKVVDDVKADFKNEVFKTSKGDLTGLTFSAGFSDEVDKGNAHELADNHLYQAKHDGRNQINYNGGVYGKAEDVGGQPDRGGRDAGTGVAVTDQGGAKDQQIGKEQKPPEAEVTPENTKARFSGFNAEALTQINSREELQGALNNLFGISGARYEELMDEENFKNDEEEILFDLAGEHQDEMEHAAWARDVEDLEGVFDDVKKEYEKRRAELSSARGKAVGSRGGTAAGISVADARRKKEELKKKIEGYEKFIGKDTSGKEREISHMAPLGEVKRRIKEAEDEISELDKVIGAEKPKRERKKKQATPRPELKPQEPTEDKPKQEVKREPETKRAREPGEDEEAVAGGSGEDAKKLRARIQEAENAIIGESEQVERDVAKIEKELDRVVAASDLRNQVLEFIRSAGIAKSLKTDVGKRVLNTATTDKEGRVLRSHPEVLKHLTGIAERANLERENSDDGQDFLSRNFGDPPQGTWHADDIVTILSESENKGTIAAMKKSITERLYKLRYAAERKIDKLAGDIREAEAKLRKIDPNYDKGESEIPFMRREIAQTDLFGGEKSMDEIEKEQRRRLEQAEIKRRQEERKGGQADMSNLPMFENQEIEGSQQTLQFMRTNGPVAYSAFIDAMNMLPRDSTARIYVHTVPGTAIIRGRRYRFSNRAMGAIDISDGGERVDVYVYAGLSTTQRAAVAAHELVGHYGKRLYLAANPEVNKQLWSLYRAFRGTKAWERLASVYADDIRGKGEERTDQILIDEWTAAKITDYLSGKKDTVARRIYNLVRQALVRMGVLRADVDDVIRAMVPLIRSVPAETVAERMREPLQFVRKEEHSLIPPEKESDYVPMKNVYDWIKKQYIKEGGRIESSRELPANKYPWPIGTWRIDDFEGTYGRAIEPLVEVDPNILSLSEEDYTKEINYEGRGDDARRYAEWSKKGLMPPPVTVVETDNGALMVSDGHRRVAAAKMAGTKLAAWISMKMKTGKTDYNGNPIYTALTYEGRKKAESILFMRQSEASFYSPTMRTIETDVKQEKGVAPQILSMIKGGKLKKAEVEWVGLEQYLKDNPQATKADVLGYLAEKQVVVNVVEKGKNLKEITHKEANKMVSEGKLIRGPDNEIISTYGQFKTYSPKTIFYSDIGVATKFTTYNPFGDGFGENPREINLVMPVSKATQRDISYFDAEKIIRNGGQVRLKDSEAVISTIAELEQYPQDELFITDTKLVRGDVYRVTPGHAYGDEADVNRIAHVRTWDVDYKGEKTLAVGEMQSDWTREAREKGVIDQKANKLVIQGLRSVENESGLWSVLSDNGLIMASDFETEEEAMRAAIERVGAQGSTVGSRGVPPMPFFKSWDELTTKKAILTAVNDGYDRVAFVNGEQTANLYDLSKKVNKLSVMLLNDGTYHVSVNEVGDNENTYKVVGDYSKEKLPEVIGKDLAEKAVVDAVEVGVDHEYSGLDLKIGGEWAKTLYDKRIPSIINDLIKKNKWNTKIETVDIGAENGPNISIAITPEMLEQMQAEGLPMFMRQPVTYQELDGMYDEVKKGKRVKTTTKKAREASLASQLLRTVAGRLEGISPMIRDVMQKHVNKIMIDMAKYKAGVIPFLKAVAKMEDSDHRVFDFAAKNGDNKKIAELVKKYGIENQYSRYRSVMDAIVKRAQEAGYDIGYLAGYFPRIPKDNAEFGRVVRGNQEWWGEIENAIAAKERSIGRPLTDDEKDRVVSLFIQGNGSVIALGKTANMQMRTVKYIEPEIADLLQSVDVAIPAYIESMTKRIARKELFGKKLPADTEQTELFGGDNVLDGADEIDDNIGTYVRDLVESKKLNPERQDELVGLLRSYFNYKPTQKTMALLKNIGYATSMGSGFSSMFSQMADSAFTYYTSPMFATQAIVKSFFGKSRYKLKELGIEDIAAEFRDPGRMAKVVDKMLGAVGLKWGDAVFKQAFVEANLKRFERYAKLNAWPKGMRERIQQTFGDETDQLISNLREGRDSDNVKLLLLNEMSKFQPITLLQVPQGYLDSPKGRIWYALKTYQVAQINAIVDEAVRIMKTASDVPEFAKGFAKLMYMVGCLVAAQAGVNAIKDAIFRRKTTMTENITDALLNLVGVSRYIAWKVRTDGIKTTLFNIAAPPFSWVDYIGKDIGSAWKYYKGDNPTFKLKNLNTLRIVPVVGQEYFWWFGGGRESNIARQKKYWYRYEAETNKAKQSALHIGRIYEHYNKLGKEDSEKAKEYFDKNKNLLALTTKTERVKRGKKGLIKSEMPSVLNTYKKDIEDTRKALEYWDKKGNPDKVDQLNQRLVDISKQFNDVVEKYKNR